MSNNITEVPEVVLSTCPFCGEEAAMYRYDSDVIGMPQYYAECMNEMCDVRPSTLLQDTALQAEIAWNARPTSSCSTNMEGTEFPDLDKYEDQFCLPEWWEDLDNFFEPEELGKLMSINKEIDECDVLSPEGLDKFLLLLREKKSLTE